MFEGFLRQFHQLAVFGWGAWFHDLIPRKYKGLNDKRKKPKRFQGSCKYFFCICDIGGRLDGKLESTQNLKNPITNLRIWLVKFYQHAR